MKQIGLSSLTWDWQSFSVAVSTLLWTWEMRPIRLQRCCSGTARGTSAQTCGRSVRSSPSSVPGCDFTHPPSVRPRSRRPWRISHSAKPYARWWRATPLVGPPWAGSSTTYEGLGMWPGLLPATLAFRRITFDPLRLTKVHRIAPHRRWTEEDLQLEGNRRQWRGLDPRFTGKPHRWSVNPCPFTRINHQWRGLDLHFTRIRHRWRGRDLHFTGIRHRWNAILRLFTGLHHPWRGLLHLFTKMHHQQDHKAHLAKAGKRLLLRRKTKNKASRLVSPTCHRTLHIWTCTRTCPVTFQQRVG